MMLKQGELRKLAIKRKKWDETMAPFDIWWKKVKRELARDWKYMMNWLFFYQTKDKGEKALHIMAVIAVDLIILRVFGII